MVFCGWRRLYLNVSSKRRIVCFVHLDEQNGRLDTFALRTQLLTLAEIVTATKFAFAVHPVILRFSPSSGTLGLV